MLRSIKNLYTDYKFFKKPPDLEDEFYVYYNQVKRFTMTTPARLYSLWKSAEYLSKYRIPGDIVECGVWKGGSMMLVAQVLQKHQDTKRNLYLYDTFKGMPKPGKEDINYRGTKAMDKWITNSRRGYNLWDFAGLDEVRKNMSLTGYPSKKIQFIPGLVEDTLKKSQPSEIALLRLDTDLYSSTAVELSRLYPRLVRGGVLIVDDYGHWLGAKKAVDEYFSKNLNPTLLTRVDYSARIAVKI